MTIQDEPRFGFRGLLLDPVRCFIPKENVLRIIDCMAMLKINKLHFHLTDDNGWRIEIKKYPRDVYKRQPFLVHNVDILSDVDLKELYDYHLQNGSVATLLDVYKRQAYRSESALYCRRYQSHQVFHGERNTHELYAGLFGGTGVAGG